MRLLSTVSLTFKEFFDADIPPYAILSHRWEPADSPLREIVFQELDDLTLNERLAFPSFENAEHLAADQLRGLKIGLFRDVARAHGYKWVWVDTCCIDKRNSAELTEAINSMFRWYKQAARCYVYFNDVDWDNDNLDKSLAMFVSSTWFKRGWTLQELLAPRFLQFYDRKWRRFGDRTTLSKQIYEASGISSTHLQDQKTASVATKMSWAARRTTSRVEDAAYSLLGLFDINMPMLYGEGMNAFLRLQRKIIKKTDDESIFAWSYSRAFKPCGMLAPSPAAFTDCGGISRTLEGAVDRRPYAMTNKGLEWPINLPVLNAQEKLHPHQTLVLGLNCERQNVSNEKGKYIAIELQKFEDGWRRVNCNRPCLYKSAMETTLQIGSRTWSTSTFTEQTRIYVVQEEE